MRAAFLSVLFAVTLVGCGCSVQDSLDLKPFTKTWPVVGPEYRAFLQGKGPVLDQDQVRARIMLCDELDAITARRAKE